MARAASGLLCAGSMMTALRTALVHLDLSDIGIDAEGIRAFDGLLKESKRLLFLDLSGNEMGDEAAVALAGVLLGCKALTRLPVDVDDNNIGDEEMLTLGIGLEHCKALSHLDLNGNEIGRLGVGDLAGVLGNSGKALACLLLGSNALGNDGARKLSGYLRECAALTLLDLDVNGIEVEGIGALAGGLD
eukprot:3567567-Rhodomonas_salina.1